MHTVSLCDHDGPLCSAQREWDGPWQGAAATTEDKLFHLQRMLSVIPKHKGTDRLQGDIKRRIANLKERIETRQKKKGPSFRVKPEGAVYVVGLERPVAPAMASGWLAPVLAIYALMARLALRPTDRFLLPPSRTMEVGMPRYL